MVSFVRYSFFVAVEPGFELGSVVIDVNLDSVLVDAFFYNFVSVNNFIVIIVVVVVVLLSLIPHRVGAHVRVVQQEDGVWVEAEERIRVGRAEVSVQFRKDRFRLVVGSPSGGLRHQRVEPIANILININVHACVEVVVDLVGVEVGRQLELRQVVDDDVIGGDVDVIVMRRRV